MTSDIRNWEPKHSSWLVLNTLRIFYPASVDPQEIRLKAREVLSKLDAEETEELADKIAHSRENGAGASFQETRAGLLAFFKEEQELARSVEVTAVK
jgi:hypothetical protein